MHNKLAAFCNTLIIMDRLTATPLTWHSNTERQCDKVEYAVLIIVLYTGMSIKSIIIVG